MKSVILITIGAILILVAIVIHENTTERERREDQVNRDLRTEVFRKVDKRDRTPVYIVGCLGGVFILAGIVVAGMGKPHGRSYSRSHDD